MLRVIFPLLLASAQLATAESTTERLVAAVEKGDTAATTELLDQWRTTGKPLPSSSEDRPLLFVAIEGREASHPEIIDLLLARGTDIAQRGPWGMSPLHWAASRGYPDRTDQILKHGAKVEAVDDFGRTPLLVAHSDAAAKLLRAKANFLATDRSGNTAFHYAAESGPAHLRLLHDAGFSVIDARNKAGWSALHFAAVSGNADSCRWLLEHGANVNAVTAAPYDFLSLHNAPDHGNELRIAGGVTAMQIAEKQHAANKWVSQRFKNVMEVLAANGAQTSWTPPAALQFLFFALAPLGPLIVIAGVFLGDARITGWHAMAQRFAARTLPRTHVNKWQDGGAGTIGLIRMRSLLRAAVEEPGLYLAFPRWISFAHPPLLLPWSELHVANDRTLLGKRIVTLHVGEPRIARVVLRGGVAPQVVDQIRQQV